ncbi:MAG: lysylphosphatidylglycerol synthase domain-containing protein [Solirubrobacterales bacterium]
MHGRPPIPTLPTDISGLTERERRLERRQVVRGVVGPIIAIAVLTALLWPHFDEILTAARLISIEAAIGLIVLHLVALLLRAEAWGRCVAAAGAPVERRLLHSSSSLRFLADTVVPTYIGAWVRIALVKRFDRVRAARPGATPTPTIGQMFTADGLMLFVEAVITVGLIAIAVFTSSLEWWWFFVFGAAVLAALLILRWLFRRYRDRDFARTARVLSDAHDRYVLTGLLAVVLTLQPIRFFIAFTAVGLDPTASEALLAFLLTTAFGALPIGPGPSSVAASATLFAGAGIDKTASAGLVLLASAVVAAAVYSVYGVFDFSRRARESRANQAGEATATSATNGDST